MIETSLDRRNKPSVSPISRTNIGPYCHASGTVRMGPEADVGAVVDQCCRVRSLANLWVVGQHEHRKIRHGVRYRRHHGRIPERASEWLREPPKRGV
jgi:hypothetical protein